MIVSSLVADEHNYLIQLHPTDRGHHRFVAEAGIQEHPVRLIADVGYVSEENFTELDVTILRAIHLSGLRWFDAD